MQFPNDIQCALMFDRRVADIDAVVNAFMRIEAAKTGARYNRVEEKQGVFHRLYGGPNLMITVERLDHPADMNVFKAALSSPMAQVSFPDAAETLVRHRSHVLVGVSSGVLTGDREVERLLKQMGVQREGATLAEFRARLEACALISRLAMDDARPSAVHWTQSDQLMKPEMFEQAAQQPAPDLLHIHALPFGGGKNARGEALAGLNSFGARHFIGGELRIDPSPIPWLANFEVMLTFLRVATMQNGYIIPDGDCFGNDDHSISYRVQHRTGELEGPPIYLLEPLRHDEHGFRSPDYVPPERVFDDRAPPADLVPVEEWQIGGVIEEWREKRRMAEGIGGRFEVRARAAFGRKR